MKTGPVKSTDFILSIRLHILIYQLAGVSDKKAITSVHIEAT